MAKGWHCPAANDKTAIGAKMSRTWSRLAGDTSRFAVELELLSDPDQGKGADRETSASWGAVKIWVEGQNLTLHTIQDQQRDQVQWYLLPLLEWLATNWDALLHEERPPVPPEADNATEALRASRHAPPTYGFDEASEWEQRWYDWWGRHALWAARDGGLFPNLTLRRWRDLAEISWDSEPLAGAPADLRFAFQSGQARLSPSDVAAPLYSVAVDATEQLAERLRDSKRIAALKRTLKALNDEKRSHSRLLWMVDAIPKGRAARQWGRVTRILDKAPAKVRDAALSTATDGLVITGSCHAALLFGAVSPSLGNADVARLAEILIDAYDPKGAQGALNELGRPEPLGTRSQPAWEQGYELATEILDTLQPAGTWVDIQRLLEELAVNVTDVELQDRAIRGVSIAGDQHRLTLCINPEYRDGNGDEIRRFTMAHELCHLLFDRAADRKLAVASGPWAPRDIERRANAFAAMFLMPLDLVLQACPNPSSLNTFDGVSTVAHILHTSVTATINHLANLDVIDWTTREDLLARHAKESAQRSTGKPDPVRG
jgi:Zn-dependent peptidase ImmA (M78 family)